MKSFNSNYKNFHKVPQIIIRKQSLKSSLSTPPSKWKPNVCWVLFTFISRKLGKFFSALNWIDTFNNCDHIVICTNINLYGKKSHLVSRATCFYSILKFTHLIFEFLAPEISLNFKLLENSLKNFSRYFFGINHNKFSTPHRNYYCTDLI